MSKRESTTPIARAAKPRHVITLINRTRIEDSILQRILEHAADALSVTGPIVVQVNQGSVPGTFASGMCFKAISRQWYHFADKNNKYPTNATTKAAIRISVPRGRRGQYLEAAEAFYKTALHEFGHVWDRQFNTDASYDHGRGSVSGRRGRWEYRPEEIRANYYRDAAIIAGHTTDRYADSILDLAIILGVRDATLRKSP